MNENRDNWDCVQDEELVRNPQPQRLPGDEEESLDESDPVPPLPLISPTVSFATTPDGLPIETASVPESAPAPPPLAVASENPVTATELLALPGDLFAVQLIAMANLDLAEEFTEEHALDKVITLQLAREDEFYVVVLLGVYDSYGAAETAVANRSQTLSEIKPWIRPLDSIQSGLRAAANLLAATE